MKKTIIMLGAVMAWVCGVFGATHEGVQLWENGPLWAKTNVGADGNLLPAYDAAAVQWGDDWRVPKASELKNLIDLCTWTWATNNNVAGYTVTGKGLYSGNSVFIPVVAGYASGTTTNEPGVSVYFWSSTADGNNTPRAIASTTSRSMRALTARWYGFSIRPVKSMSAAKAASAAALDTRTGTRVAKTTESIAYDAAWGGASSGTLKIFGETPQ